MKHIAGVLLVAVFCNACKKEPVIEENVAFVSVINTVPATQRLAVYVDTVFQFRIPYRSSYRNLQLTADTHVVSVRDSVGVKNLLSLSPQDFMTNTTSTIIVYDTIHPVDSTVRAIRLSDDLTLAPGGFVKVRFIHAAPLMNPVDVTFLRTSVTPFDSVTLSNRQYIGNAGNAQSISAFNSIPLGNYTLKIKSVGTQDTLVNTVKLSVSNLAGAAGISGITTFYVSGGVQSQPLEVGLFRHYP